MLKTRKNKETAEPGLSRTIKREEVDRLAYLKKRAEIVKKIEEKEEKKKKNDEFAKKIHESFKETIK